MQVVHKKTRRTPQQVEADVLALLKAGKTIGVIQSAAAVGQSKVYEVCDKYGIEHPRRVKPNRPAKRRRQENYKNDPHIPDEVRDLDKCVTTKLTDLCSKVNPRALARQKMPDRFTEHRDMLHFDGAWIKDFIAWDNVIKELNKKLKAEGKRQIDYNKAWVV